MQPGTQIPGTTPYGTPGAAGRPPAQLPQQNSSGAVGKWPDFSLLDANGDGFLNRDEGSAHAALAGRWTEFDTDQSGSIDSGEYIRARSLRNTDSPMR